MNSIWNYNNCHIKLFHLQINRLKVEEMKKNVFGANKTAAKRQRAMERKQSDSDRDEENGLDSDGNPITVSAAQKMYHSNKNTIYCKQPMFRNRN